MQSSLVGIVLADTHSLAMAAPGSRFDSNFLSGMLELGESCHPEIVDADLE